ncbi:putative Gnk2-like domain-containing protein [Lupinus albus]|uniref:Putative Gnk2-like domain-containing protein n=1 Tax=Lupinus albus TaxID=3870 RepID=A0A6A4QDI9_LUPAL|nr:putative Gnk2-like domain-containing protein [Lupinus albus]
MSQCSFCLNESISVIPSCCNNRKGARIVRPSCNLRYETDFLFSEEAIAYAPSPPPSTDAPPSSLPLPTSQGISNKSRNAAIHLLLLVLCLYLCTLR